MIDIKKVVWWEWLLLIWLLYDFLSIAFYLGTQHGTPETNGRYIGSTLSKWILIGIGYYIFVYRARTKQPQEV
jgi:hypothetical protein